VAETVEQVAESQEVSEECYRLEDQHGQMNRCGQGN
jgi:hypothetical protein